jgi:hypothetical protein
MHNWYKEYKFHCEASIGNNVPAKIASALYLFFSILRTNPNQDANDILQEVSTRKSIPIEEMQKWIEQYDQDIFFENVIDQYNQEVQDTNQMTPETPKDKPNQPEKQVKSEPESKNKPKPSSISMDTISKYVLQHEGVGNQGKTPFRITNKRMRSWTRYKPNKDHIGFPIDQDKTSGSNFLYFKNPSDVITAIKMQFSNYANNPSRYGLPQSPTLENAIRKFDQSGADSKIKFLKNHIAGLDVRKPLKSFL